MTGFYFDNYIGYNELYMSPLDIKIGHFLHLDLKSFINLSNVTISTKFWCHWNHKC